MSQILTNPRHENCLYYLVSNQAKQMKDHVDCVSIGSWGVFLSITCISGALIYPLRPFVGNTSQHFVNDLCIKTTKQIVSPRFTYHHLLVHHIHHYAPLVTHQLTPLIHNCLRPSVVELELLTSTAIWYMLNQLNLFDDVCSES